MKTNRTRLTIYRRPYNSANPTPTMWRNAWPTLTGLKLLTEPLEKQDTSLLNFFTDAALT